MRGAGQPTPGRRQQHELVQVKGAAGGVTGVPIAFLAVQVQDEVVVDLVADGDRVPHGGDGGQFLGVCDTE